MPTPAFMSFEEWAKENADLEDTLVQEGVECNFCDGTGEAECESCGHVRWCEECDKGIIKQPGSDAIKAAMRKLYNEQQAADKKKWEAWSQSQKEVQQP